MYVAYQLLTSTYIFQYPRLNMEPPLEGRFDCFNLLRSSLCVLRGWSLRCF